MAFFSEIRCMKKPATSEALTVAINKAMVIVTATLVGFGVPRAPAILGVIGWRLVQFWLPIPVGALSYVSIRAQGASREAKAEELETLYRDARGAAEDLPAWAGRHGVVIHKREHETP